MVFQKIVFSEMKLKENFNMGNLAQQSIIYIFSSEIN